ncbi:MAG TPA: TonB-dependent receptor [Methylophilaceae bacterium]|nr:TonB-dependent receptor [Methylophilaceae bacterium]
MKKIALAGLLALLNSTSVFALEPTGTDEVVVTASRIPETREHVIADVTVVDHEEIERAGQSTLVELLQTQPGVEISSSGGAGKASSVFLRGTNADHVVVLLDGLRINSATLGTTAFENIPLAQIDHIEILRGPASSLYGADAIGGVIQIFTKKGSGKPSIYAAAGYGSYNTKTAEAGTSGKVNQTSYSLNIASYDTEGVSAENFKTGPQKDKDGYRNLSVSGSLSQQIAEGHDIGLQFFQSEGHNNYDGGNTFPNYGETTQLSYALSSKNRFTSNWLSTLRIGAGIDDEDDHSSSFSRSFFKTTQRQYTWQNDLSLPLGTLTLLYEKLEQRVDSDSGTPYDKTARDNEALLASYLVNVGPHSLQASYRSDHNTQFGTYDTGSVGYGFSFSPNWRATASYGTAFKAPTFNQLYFPFGVGDPTLQPEESRNLEAGLHYEHASTSLSAVIFDNKIRNLIFFDLGSFKFANVNAARIQGLTLTGAQRWDNWQIKGSADIQSPRDENTDNLLNRRAQRHGTIGLSYADGDWRLGSEVVVSSHRYNDDVNTKRLGGYAIFNLTADYAINKDWQLQARANNVFNKDYTLAYDSFNNVAYNTPGANVFVSVRYQPGNR